MIMFLLQKIFLKAKAAIGAAMILLMFTGGTASAKDKLLEAENLVLSTIDMPCFMDPAKDIIPATEWYRGSGE